MDDVDRERVRAEFERVVDSIDLRAALLAHFRDLERRGFEYVPGVGWCREDLDFVFGRLAEPKPQLALPAPGEAAVTDNHRRGPRP